MAQAAVGYLFAEEVTAAIDRYSREVADAVVEKAQKLCTLYSKVLRLRADVSVIQFCETATTAVDRQRPISHPEWWFCLQDVDGSDHEMKVEAKVAVGDARAVICHMADKLGADVLVMGSHGYGFFKRYDVRAGFIHSRRFFTFGFLSVGGDLRVRA